ncbi:MAG: L-aspartate oxidase [Desulfovibrionaceae bacterium]
MNDHRLSTQVLVIGSGIAGATTALVLADQGFEVTLLSAGPALDSGNTALAQGGIVYRAEDDPAQLEKDIMIAGWRHNYPRAVKSLARKGPQSVQQILVERLGIPFCKQATCDEWDMTREGGHAAKRVLYCMDYTGRAIMDGLMHAVLASPNIRALTQRTAVDLLTSQHHASTPDFKYQLANQCAGAYVFNETTGQVETVLADFTVLATGGVGQIYLHSTNASSAIGSGVSMAWRAGARVLNAEFVQFHPTAFYHRSERRFLITEALRGEGARLVNAAGERFMQRHDPRGDLAPRDIVARAIVEEMLRTDEPCVYLDAANHVHHDLHERFPTVFEHCLKHGVDIRRDPIPVVPAAHYFCGGVLVDLHGRTMLDRLYAVGECSCTGLHGANRLASTSLLEGLVWGQQAGQDIARRLAGRSALSRRLKAAMPDWEHPGENHNEDPALIAQDWATIRHTMWNYVGITRSTPRLERAHDDLRNLYKHLVDFYRRTPLSKPLIDLFHGSHAAYIVTLAAMRNKKSLGCHYRAD